MNYVEYCHHWLFRKSWTHLYILDITSINSKDNAWLIWADLRALQGWATSVDTWHAAVGTKQTANYQSDTVSTDSRQHFNESLYWLWKASMSQVNLLSHSLHGIGKFKFFMNLWVLMTSVNKLCTYNRYAYIGTCTLRYVHICMLMHQPLQMLMLISLLLLLLLICIGFNK